MISILHIIPTLGYGGAERQLYYLAKQQVNNGFKVCIALRKSGIYESDLKNNGVEIVYIGNYRGPNPLMIFNLIKLIRKKRPNIIQSWLPQMDIICGILLFFVDICWIMTERVTKAGYSNIPFQKSIRYFMGRRAKIIIANSIEGLNDWRDNYNCNAIMIENAVDINKINNANIIDNSNFSYPLLLMVGSLEERKNYPTLLKAVKLVLKKIEIFLLIIGSGSRKQSLIHLISKLNIKDHVIVKPYEPDWWGYLKISNIFVSPSLIEGQPNVVLEAMAAKCPLIVSNIPAHKQILNEKSALFVPINDEVKLAEAILEQISNPKLGKNRAEQAFNRLESMTIESITKKYENVYLSILR